MLWSSVSWNVNLLNFLKLLTYSFRDATGNGACGLGPKFCGENCTSTCDQKSNCNPGWGMQWSKADKCPLNVCCSEYGFCGTTEDFCGGTKVTAPSCPAGQGSSNNRLIGYYEAWNSERACDSELRNYGWIKKFY